jgi:hypothetical protein
MVRGEDFDSHAPADKFAQGSRAVTVIQPQSHQALPTETALRAPLFPHPEVCQWKLAAFPTGVHDDSVDSTTQALNYLRLNSGEGGILFVGRPRRWPEPELSGRFPEPFRHESLLTKIL